MKQIINRKDKKMRKRIMAINANDFGGKTGHLMSHRYFNNRDRRYHIDWRSCMIGSEIIMKRSEMPEKTTTAANMIL